MNEAQAISAEKLLRDGSTDAEVEIQTGATLFEIVVLRAMAASASGVRRPNRAAASSKGRAACVSARLIRTFGQPHHA